jgi:lysophospholipase L1-like esterase
VRRRKFITAALPRMAVQMRICSRRTAAHLACPYIAMKTTSRRAPGLVLLLVAVALSRGWAADEAAKRWAQYEPSFKAFAEQDAANPPVKGGILFVGSSIFRQWTNVAEQMAPLPVLNRAFGGSRTGDQLARFDQVILPYAPKVIVYYCGSNDLKAKPADEPEVIFGRFREWSQRVQRAAPATRIVYASSTRAPDRVARWEQVDHFNALVRAYCAATPHHTFVDLNPALVDANGHPRLDLYRDDKLHFHPPAYEAFAAILKPVLEKIWREVAPPANP